MLYVMFACMLSDYLYSMPRGRGRGCGDRTRDQDRTGGDGIGIGVTIILQRVDAQMTQLTQAVQRNTDVTQNVGANQWIREVVRMNPPRFTGATDALGWDGWLLKLGKILEVVDCPEERKVSVAQFLLDNDDANWWEAVKPRDLVVTWAEFQGFMRDEFCPEPIRNQRIIEFFSARPQDVPLSQAIIDLSKQLSYVQDQVRTKEDKICHFARRMNPEILQYMAGFTCTSLREYQNKALAYDLSISSTEHVFESKRLKTIGNFSRIQESEPLETGISCHRSKKVPQSHDHGKSITPLVSNVSHTKTCYNCSRAGHTTKNCRSPLVNCFACGQLGHRSVHCETVTERFGERVFISAPKGHGDA
ncbi:hypothetical protein OROGR_028185 [Orobanche gracilis]